MEKLLTHKVRNKRKKKRGKNNEKIKNKMAAEFLICQ